MNDNAKAWVAALRSGKFRQARKHLRTEQGHCCLGVACEVYRQHTGNGRWMRSIKDSNVIEFRMPGNYWRAQLPPEVARWLGLAPNNPWCSYDHVGGKARSLTDDNDDGADFFTIANTIENKLFGDLDDSA